MSKLFLILILVAAAVSTSQARSVRAIFLQPPKNAPKVAYLYSETQTLKIKLPKRNLSRSVKIPRGDLSFAILAHTLIEGEEVPKEAQIIKIPQQWRNCLLVFIPNPNNQAFPAKVLPIDTSNNQFPIGGTLVYNFTDSLFIGKFGNEALRVKPWKSKIVKTKANKGVRHYPVAIDYVDATTEKRAALTRTNWIHHPEARQLLFVTKMPNHKVPRVWGVLDHTLENVEDN